MENLLENADVTRISVNHARDFYKIYVKANALFSKKIFGSLRKALKNRYLKVKILQ